MNGQKIYVLRRSKTEIHTYEGRSLRTAGISSAISCKVQQACPSSSGRVSATSEECNIDENKDKFENLFCEIADLKKIIEQGGFVNIPPCTGYLKYFTPSGRIIELPCDAIPGFNTNTSLPVHPSALVRFEIITGNPEYGPPGIYRALYIGNEFKGYIKDGTFPYRYYLFPQAVELTNGSFFNSEDKLISSFVLPVISSPTVSLPPAPARGIGVIPANTYTYDELFRELGLFIERDPTKYLKFASGAVTFICALLAPANYGSVSTGEGELTQELPELLFDPQSSNRTIIKPALDPSTFPKYAPVIYPFECEPFLEPGTCGVYVITGPNFGKEFPERQGQFDNAKYGMTCNLNGTRPQRQVNSFNIEHKDKILETNSVNFDWRWIRTNISKPECHLLEKDLTAEYIKQNGGRLPWKHGLPKFKEVEIDNQTGFESIESLQERFRRAIKHLQDRINSCK